jgi:hypothetical protein
MHCDPAYLQDGTESTLLKNPLSISSAQNLSDYGKDILNNKCAAPQQSNPLN